MTRTEYPDAPRLAVGGVVIHQNRVLLALRGKPPAQGEWAVPGGSVHLGETLQAAVERELLEETGLHVQAGEVIYTFEKIERDSQGRVRFHYVILDLLCRPLDPETPLRPADDVLDARWFSRRQLAHIPVTETTRTLLEKVLPND